jgi:uncharacterized protein YndB with AHSA1/START domain
MTDTSTVPELVFERTFAAPRELVWRAWTEADALNQWWGPHIFENRVISLDLWPGGLFRYAMKMPSGEESFGRFVFDAIEPVSRLAYRSAFADADGNAIRAPWDSTFPLEIASTVTLEEVAGGTKLTLRARPHNPTAEEAAAFEGLRGSMDQGFNGTLDQLEQYLSKP